MLDGGRHWPLGHGCHGAAVGHGPGDGGVLGDSGGYHAVGFEVMAAATQALEVAGVNPCGGEPGTAATVSGRKSAGGKCDLRR